jgi:diacylglycerol kinase (ATP)
MAEQLKSSPERRSFLNLSNRVIWSLQGSRDAWENEASFRSWVYINVISVVMVFMLPLSLPFKAMIIALGLLILCVELLNTALERLADLVEPKDNPLIKACKDAGSAAVAVSGIAGGLAWLFAIYSLL